MKVLYVTIHYFRCTAMAYRYRISLLRTKTIMDKIHVDFSHSSHVFSS